MPSFTLVELLVVVVAILGLLAGLLIPVTQKAIAAGKTGKATGNLRQVGILMNSYIPENNNRLPIAIASNWNQFHVTNMPFFQNLLRIHAGQGVRGDPLVDPWLPDIFYDPAVKKGKQHLFGCYGVNDAIVLRNDDCVRVFGQGSGVPIHAISPLSGKVVMTSAKDGPGSRWGSSWYINGRDWIQQGTNSQSPAPDARHGGKALCLFADGHVEALDILKMNSADRTKYFQQDPTW